MSSAKITLMAAMMDIKAMFAIGVSFFLNSNIKLFYHIFLKLFTINTLLGSMHKKLFVMTGLIVGLATCSCSKTKPDYVSYNSYEYNDIVDFSIDFNEIFLQDLEYYFVYVYQLNCLHCELIKQEVIQYALSNKLRMYFLEYTNKIKVEKDVSQTIGATRPEEVAILGTPSLFLISNKKLTLNVAGMDLVKSVLREFN